LTVIYSTPTHPLKSPEEIVVSAGGFIRDSTAANSSGPGVTNQRFWLNTIWADLTAIPAGEAVPDFSRGDQFFEQPQIRVPDYSLRTKSVRGDFNRTFRITTAAVPAHHTISDRGPFDALPYR
jgi:hypothetical protein